MSRICVRFTLLLLVLLNIFKSTKSTQVQTAANAMDVIRRVNERSREQDRGVTLRELDIVHVLPVATAAGRGEFSAGIKRGRGRLWPSGVINYILSKEIRASPSHVAGLRAAMEAWQSGTCLRFVEQNISTFPRWKSYVEVIKGTRCFAQLGRYYGRSFLSLGPGCQYFGVPAHEVGHVLGLVHEHNRPDRDNYVEILWENTKPNMWVSFWPRLKRDYTNYGVPYNFRSIMHYGSRVFSKNGRHTIKARNPARKPYFGNYRPNALDFQKVNAMYQCSVYPKFPSDFTFGSTSDPTKICIQLNQTLDPAWGVKYLCYKPAIKKMNITWSTNGGIAGLQCINTEMPFESTWRSWARSFLCVPSEELYQFHWDKYGRPSRDWGDCLKFRDNRHAGYHLCARKRRRDIDGGWSSWASWSKCDRDCGGGVQLRTRQCNQPTPANGGKACTGASFETRSCNQGNCPDWPHWPNDFRFLQQTRVPGTAGFTCINVYDRTDFRARGVFCWVKWKKPLAFRWSDVGALRGMRCTRITEPATSAWNNNHLCTAGDYPYQFRWSSRGPISGLRCLQWRPGGSRPGWNDNYLCATEFPRPTKAPTNGCFGGWPSFQVGNVHYCYLRLFKKVTWHEAQRECRSRNASLISIGSETEHKFVLKDLLDGYSSWIGFNDENREGDWVWSDGARVTFTKWARSEPNPDDRGENCAMVNVRRSYWNDWPCTTKFSFICKARGRSV